MIFKNYSPKRKLYLRHNTACLFSLLYATTTIHDVLESGRKQIKKGRNKIEIKQSAPSLE